MDGYLNTVNSPAKGVQAERVTKNSILMDTPRLRHELQGVSGRMSWHPSGKRSKYNILFGDGSVQVLDDAVGDWLYALAGGNGRWGTGGAPPFPDAKEPRPQVIIPGTGSDLLGWKDNEFFDVVDQYFGAPAFVPMK